MANSSVEFRNAVTSGWGETRSALRLPRLMLLLAVLFAGLGFSAPAQAQAIVTWDYSSVMAYDGSTGGPLDSGDSVDIGTTVDFFIYFYDGSTYSSTPSGCNIVHVSDNHWQGTITKTCHIAGNAVPIMIMSTGPSEATVGEYYSGGVYAAGGDSPYTYTLEVPGSLPDGLTFNDGTVSGTPSEEIIATYLVRATNEYGHTATEYFTLTVHSDEPAGPAVSWSRAGGSADVTATAGGVTLSSGDSVPAGSVVEFRVKPEDGMTYPGAPLGCTVHYISSNAAGDLWQTDPLAADCAVQFRIAYPGIFPGHLGIPDAVLGQPYVGVQFGIQSSYPPFNEGTWSLSGDLPTGLNLSTTGALSGTPLEPGDFTFDLTVTNGAGHQIRVFNHVITVVGGSADLSALVLSEGPLTPGFGSGTMSYGATVPHGTETITVTPTADDPEATITVDGRTVASGSASAAIPLAVGDTPVTIVVTAQDGITTNTYTVNVTREAASAPTITGVLPDTGPEVGGTVVTITGANLTDASAVAFDSTPATSYTVDSDAQIRAVTPAGSAGAADVAVTTPGGTVTETGAFTYAAAAPNVSFVTIPDGTYTAGEAITIQVYYNDVIVVSGNPRLQIDIGGTTRYADYDAHGGVAVRFNYVVQAGDLAPSGIGLGPSISLNGGTIESTGGTAANLTLNGIPDLSGVIVDAVAPTATSSAVTGSPAPDAMTVGFDVTFSEQVNGVDPSDFALTTTGSAAGTVAGIGTADGVTYHVNVTGISGIGSLRLDVLADGSITDLADNPMTVAYTSGAPWARGGSADATLASLGSSAGALDPAFDPATTGYDVAVGNATDSITLTPTAAEPNATLTVDGQTVASGSASQQIALTVGDTAIPVVVTAEDGATTQTYTVTVTRAASADATLAGLTPSAGALDPAFDPATTAYAVAVGNATDSITLTPTAAEPNATLTVDGQTVASGSASQAIALPIGSTAIQVVVTAQDGATTQTYTVTVTRAASTDATLAGLTPSAGALDPAFDPATTAYAVAVDNATDSITLTPTASEQNATITVNGQGVTSGSTSQAIALSTGSTAIQVVVTAEDGMTSRTYAVTVERAQPVPTVISRTIEINAGETASVDLTEGASGSPFTDAAIVDLSSTEAGTAVIERDGQSYRLVFASSSTYAGGADIRFTLSNATGTSTPGTLAFTILGRPDPSQDPEVIGLLTAQVDAARRFAQVQTRNFNDRLEQLHDEGDRRSNSMNVRLGIAETDRAGRAEREIRRMIENGHGANAKGVVPGLLAYGSGSSSGDEDTVPATAFASPDLGSFAVWTGGFVNFGERENGSLDIGHTLVGLSGGVDYRFSDKFVAGFGAGYGRDRSDIGVNGTESRASAYSAAIYGSYKPFDSFFIDGLIGGSWLDFDSNRYVTATGDFATGSRSGRQLFGSMTAAYDVRDETWLISPYGRIEFSRSWLDGFTERSGGGMALRYGDQTIDSVSGVLGIRAEYTFAFDWGTLTPGARMEFTHDFAGSSRARLGYADLGGLPYAFEIEPAEESYATLGLSLEAALPHDWSLGLDYRTSVGRDHQDHAFGLRAGKKF